MIKLGGILDEIKDELISTGFFVHSCYRLGRACRYYSEEKFLHKNDIALKCREGNLLLINYDGEVFPCGSIYSVANNWRVCKINETDINDLIKICNHVKPKIKDVVTFYKKINLKINILMHAIFVKIFGQLGLCKSLILK